MSLTKGYYPVDSEPNVYDDKAQYEDMPPHQLGQLRDYIARNLTIRVHKDRRGKVVTLQLEGIDISRADFYED